MCQINSRKRSDVERDEAAYERIKFLFWTFVDNREFFTISFCLKTRKLVKLIIGARRKRKKIKLRQENVALWCWECALCCATSSFGANYALNISSLIFEILMCITNKECFWSFAEHRLKAKMVLMRKFLISLIKERCDDLRKKLLIMFTNSSVHVVTLPVGPQCIVLWSLVPPEVLSKGWLRHEQ